MATPKSVWGIDIGQCALKAVKLISREGELQVEAFDIIEHAQILSQPDADRKQLVHASLEQFLARNNIAGSTIVVAVPGQSSFTRFVKLPPVESKRIPDIVRFEAEQQIPFPINDVIWRWQTFQDPDSPDVEVGIFAMKKVDVGEMLGHFSEIEFNVDIVQMAPLALYNFMTFDEQRSPDGATLLMDVGVDKTDLVLADGARIWTRSIPVGGNNFTEALTRAFKLSFAKAEKLKRTAITSKYARQIFQAMRPVFADLVQEIQRSIGYYTSLHRETRFKKLVGLGNGFRLPGLQKFLEQNLSMPVVRIDSYNKVTPSAAISAATFNENVLTFPVAYGLALQGLDRGAVSTNLLPDEVARKRLWARKRPWFVAAAAVLVASLGIMAGRSFMDRNELKAEQNVRVVESNIQEMQKLVNDYRQLVGQGADEERQVRTYLRLFGYREFWPSLMDAISRSIAAAAEDQSLFNSYGSADEKKRAEIIEKLKAKPNRQGRHLFVIESMTARYYADASLVAPFRSGAAPAGLPSGGPPKQGQSAGVGRPCFLLTITGRTPMNQNEANTRIYKIFNSLQSTNMFKILDHAVTRTTSMSAAKPAAAGAPAEAEPSRSGKAPVVANPDPLFPTEDMSNDTVFELRVLVSIEGDGIALPKMAGE